MNGWWCVRFGDALAWVEAPSAPAAMWRSLDLDRRQCPPGRFDRYRLGSGFGPFTVVCTRPPSSPEDRLLHSIVVLHPPSFVLFSFSGWVISVEEEALPSKATVDLLARISSGASASDWMLGGLGWSGPC